MLSMPIRYYRFYCCAILLALVGNAPAREATTQSASATIEFLGRAAARKAIIDESMEPYFRLLQPMEMSVKTGEPIGDGTLEQQRDRCRKRYQDAMEEFTDEQKEALRWYISKLMPMVAADYPLYAKTPWSFIKISSKFEGGMPHTRGPHIVLSDGVLGTLVQAKRQAPQWMALAQFGDVLLHEQSHVVQRQHPRQMASLYTELWKFKHVGTIEGGDWITRHQIVNPDGVDVRWIFPIQEGQKTRWIWPLIVFGGVDDPAKASFGNMQMIAVEVEPAGADAFKAKMGDDGKPVMQDLMGVSQYTSVFRISQNIYHPNEAAADLFAKLVIVNKVLPGNVPAESNEQLDKAKTELEPLNQWFKKVLKDL
jgi:hypothetical protein